MAAVSLPVDAGSAGAARRLLRMALDGHQPAATEDAVLMISELVTNAVRHTRALLLVLITVHGHMLRVDVSDDNPALPVAPSPEHYATNGRGLRSSIPSPTDGESPLPRTARPSGSRSTSENPQPEPDGHDAPVEHTAAGVAASLGPCPSRR